MRPRRNHKKSGIDREDFFSVIHKICGKTNAKYGKEETKQAVAGMIKE